MPVSPTIPSVPALWSGERTPSPTVRQAAADVPPSTSAAKPAAVSTMIIRTVRPVRSTSRAATPVNVLRQNAEVFAAKTETGKRQGHPAGLTDPKGDAPFHAKRR